MSDPSDPGPEALELVTESNRDYWIRLEKRHAVLDLGLLRLDGALGPCPCAVA
jgi:hypothetical protein